MPRGSKPGEGNRGGGRKKGTLNKVTIERSLLAEREMNAAKVSGGKLAKEVLDDFMRLFAGMAAVHQPLPPGQEQSVIPGRKPDEVRFEKWARLAVETARDLAKYQSPSFRAVAIVPQGPDTAKGFQRRTITFGISQDGGPLVDVTPARKAKA